MFKIIAYFFYLLLQVNFYKSVSKATALLTKVCEHSYKSQPVKADRKKYVMILNIQFLTQDFKFNAQPKTQLFRWSLGLDPENYILTDMNYRFLYVT